MSRVLDVYHFRCVDGKMEKYWLSYWIAKAIDFSFATKKPEGIKVGGCGMDVGFEVVYNLGRVLYPNGVECCGKTCCSNDHMNGNRNYEPHLHRDGGYAFNQEWL